MYGMQNNGVSGFVITFRVVERYACAATDELAAEGSKNDPICKTNVTKFMGRYAMKW